MAPMGERSPVPTTLNSISPSRSGPPFHPQRLPLLTALEEPEKAQGEGLSLGRSLEAKMHRKSLGGAWGWGRLKISEVPQPHTSPLSVREDQLCLAAGWPHRTSGLSAQPSPKLQALYIARVSIALGWTLTSGRT